MTKNKKTKAKKPAKKAPSKKALPYFAHKTAVVDAGATIGEGTTIWHFSHIMPKAVLGKGCRLGQNVYIGNVKIGNNVKIQNNVSVYDEVELEDDVFCGPSMVFTNVINPRSHVNRKNEYLRTLVKRGASIGANATIVCGTTIGQYAFIGAGSVVTKDVLPYAKMMGVPARQKGWMCQCGISISPIKDHLKCATCGQNYEITEEGLVSVHAESATA